MSEACAVPKCAEGATALGVCGRHLSEAAAHKRKGASWSEALALVVAPEGAEVAGAPDEEPFDSRRFYRLKEVQVVFAGLGEDALRRLLAAVPRVKLNRKIVAWLGRDLNAFLASKTLPGVKS